MELSEASLTLTKLISEQKEVLNIKPTVILVKGVDVELFVNGGHSKSCTATYDGKSIFIQNNTSEDVIIESATIRVI